MKNPVNRFLGGIVDHPWLATSLVVAITALSLIGYRDPELLLQFVRSPVSSDVKTAINDSVEPAEKKPNVDPFRLTDADTILVLDSDQFFTVEGAKCLRRSVERLESLDYVARVMWFDKVPIVNVFGLPEPILPRTDGTQTLLENAKRKALDHPLVVGQFMSEDAKTIVLMVLIDWVFVQSDEDVTEGLLNVVREEFESSGIEVKVGATGRVPLYLASKRSESENTFKYQMLGYAVIFLAALVLFRGPTAVFVVAFAPALGVFWTLGILRFFELQYNPFNAVILPTMLSLVGLTDSVHVMVQIRHHRAAGLTPRDATRKGTGEVGLACVLTSVTTAIGFGSLGLAGHEVVRNFGWSCVIGVTLTLIAILTVIPLACRTILGNRIHVGHDSGVIQKRLLKISGLIDWVIVHRRLVSWVAIGSTIALAVVCLWLQPDERRERGLPDNAEAVLTLRHMDSAFGGLETGEVRLRWSRETADDDEQILQLLTTLQDTLQSEPLIGSPLSIVNLIEDLPGGGSAGNRMPMIELLPAPLKRAFYVPEDNVATIMFRVQDLGIAKYASVFQRLDDQFETLRAEHPSFEIDLAGNAVWRWKNLYRIVTDLATSLGAASLIIFIVLGLVYRSIRIGFISVIPNMFPLVLTGAMLVFLGQGLEMVSVCAFTVCLGIAVDDTIHFITRYLECAGETDDNDEAIRRAFVGVGTALITTTIVLVAGFSTVLFSDSRDHLIFASMGIATFLSALFADLFFLPALLAHFGPKRPRI